MVDLIHIVAAASTACLDNGNACATGLPMVSADSQQLKTILQLVFGILAAVAVLMVMIGGFRYVTSEGNPDATTRARGTILYAIVGLAIALVAEGIVSFFLGKVS